MSKTKLYGHSDDLIEIEGDISAESDAYKPKHFNFSDGTKGKIFYDDEGIWRIDVKEKGFLFDKLVKCVDEETPHTDEDAIGCTSYSDVLIMNDGIGFVKVGKKMFTIQ